MNTYTCERCSHYARLNAEPEPHYHEWEMDLESGLCNDCALDLPDIDDDSDE